MELSDVISNVIFVLTCYALLQCSECKFVVSELKTTEDWIFLTRFCYLSQNGALTYEIDYPAEYDSPSLLLYYDGSQQWPSVYKSDKSCVEKTSPPHIYAANGQVIDLSIGSSGCNVNSSAPNSVHCSRTNIKVSASRERWWYIAVSRCTPKNPAYVGIRMTYKLTMTNGENAFQRHFSADEFYILEVDIAFCCAFAVLTVISIIVAALLRKQQMLHSTFKLFMMSLYFEFMHLVIMCAYYGSYSADGIENYAFKTFGRVLDSISILIFIFMLLLMAKGFTITRGRISVSGSIKLAIFMTVYIIVYAILFIYEAEFFDPGEVLYIYESPAGYGLLGLQLVAWLWFSYGVFITLKHFPDKAKFYFPFFVIYTIWFWANPFVIFIANFVLAKYIRAKIVNLVERIILLLGFVFFTFLTWPSRANTNFPYHIRTTQIDVLQNYIPESTADETDNSVDNGPNFHSLSDIRNSAVPNHYDVFCTQQPVQNRKFAGGESSRSVNSDCGKTSAAAASVSSATNVVPSSSGNMYTDIPPRPSAPPAATSFAPSVKVDDDRKLFTMRSSSVVAVAASRCPPVADDLSPDADNVYDRPFEDEEDANSQTVLAERERRRRRKAKRRAKARESAGCDEPADNSNNNDDEAGTLVQSSSQPASDPITDLFAVHKKSTFRDSSAGNIERKPSQSPPQEAGCDSQSAEANAAENSGRHHFSLSAGQKLPPLPVTNPGKNGSENKPPVDLFLARPSQT